MRFHKYHALGNDYIVLDPADYPDWKEPDTGQIRVICHRNFGIGSDGILWGPLPSEAKGAAESFGLRIFYPTIPCRTIVWRKRGSAMAAAAN